jgi:hypothetical protein
MSGSGANLLTPQTKRLIKDSFQTFVLALCLFAFAIGLSFVEDFCKYTQRPRWMNYGLEYISIVFFVTDALVMIGVAIRIVLRTVKETVEFMKK